MSTTEPLFVTLSGIKVFDWGDYFRFIMPPTDGKPGGEDWLTRLEGKRRRVDLLLKNIRHLLLDFKPTNGVVYEVVVLKGVIFDDNERRIDTIRTYANSIILPDKCKLSTPSLELACFIHEQFTKEEFDALRLKCVIAMHIPTIGVPGYESDSEPCLLAVYSYLFERMFNDPLYCTQLGAGHAFARYPYNYGFAFAVSQSSSQY